MLKNKYRKNVGMMILNSKNQVWMGDVSLSKTSPLHQNYHFQMPQGGIEKGESPEQAMWRELWEETGLTQKSLKKISESKHWYRYDFPEWIAVHKKHKGQRQKWFLLRFIGQNSDFDFNHENPAEFYRYEWREKEEIDKLIVPFKQKVYQKVVREFMPFLEKKEDK